MSEAERNGQKPDEMGQTKRVKRYFVQLENLLPEGTQSSSLTSKRVISGPIPESDQVSLPDVFGVTKEELIDNFDHYCEIYLQDPWSEAGLHFDRLIRYIISRSEFPNALLTNPNYVSYTKTRG